MNDRLTVALAALLNYEQADMHGERCTTSRQAVHEVADAVVAAHVRIAELELKNDRLKAELELADEALTVACLCGAADAKADKVKPIPPVIKDISAITSKPLFPSRLFLPPDAFDGYSKRLNIYGKDHVCDGEDFVEYRRADLAPKIKRLEWDEWDGGMTVAKTTFGDYNLNADFRLKTPIGSYLLFETEKSAKAAAQAHYETLVLGCL